jgi:hypothetical protein
MKKKFKKLKNRLQIIARFNFKYKNKTTLFLERLAKLFDKNMNYIKSLTFYQIIDTFFLPHFIFRNIYKIKMKKQFILQDLVYKKNKKLNKQFRLSVKNNGIFFYLKKFFKFFFKNKRYVLVKSFKHVLLNETYNFLKFISLISKDYLFFMTKVQVFSAFLRRRFYIDYNQKRFVMKKIKLNLKD